MALKPNMKSRPINEALGDSYGPEVTLSTPEQDCIAFRSKDASMIPTRMPSSTGLSAVGVRLGSDRLFGRVGVVAGVSASLL